MAIPMLATTIVCSLLWCVTSSQDSLSYTLTEEVPVGTFIGNIATDAGLWEQYDSSIMQQFRYRFLEPSADDTNYFSINEISSVIQIAVIIDRDELCPRQAECQIQQDTAAVSPDGHFHVFTVIFSIQDTNDNWPIFPQQAVRIEIAESASVGSLYNLPLAQDQDSTEFGIQQYTLSSSDSFELVISPTTVQLKITSVLDRETRDFYQLVLYAYDGGSPPHSASLLLNVSVSDANDHGPVFPNSTVTISISESTPVYTTIATLTATDPDLGVNGMVSYALSPSLDASTLQMFSVGAGNGQVILQDNLDFESKTSYSLIIEALDGGSNSQPGYCTLIVAVQDSNDNPPEIIINTLTGAPHADISENQEPGRFVAHVTIRDPDQGVGGQFDCVVSDTRFQLTLLQGNRYEIRTTQSFDRETHDEQYVDILCQDYGTPSLSSSRQLQVTITDENDNAPQFSQSTYTVHMAENNHLDKIIIQVNASDMDVGRNGEVRYVIGDSAQDLVSIDFITGIIRASAVFDYEEVTEISFLVIAMDDGVSPLSSTSTVTVLIEDENDMPPIFTEPQYSFMVTENRPRGLEIGVVLATDADSHLYSQVQYAFINDDADDTFTIDPHTGHVRTLRELDREERSVYMLTVLAINQGLMPPLSGTALVTVTVLDENDNSPVFEFPNMQNFTFQVSNQAPEGAEVGVIIAQDEDQGSNSRLTYSITGGNEGDNFLVDRDTGMITVKSSLTHYDIRRFELLVSAQDQGNPPKTDNGILYIQVNSSLVFAGARESLLNNNNVTIVIALVTCSILVIAVLIVAIVCMRSRDLRKKTARQHQYHLNIQTPWSAPADIEDMPSRDPDGKSDRGSVIGQEQDKDPSHSVGSHRGPQHSLNGFLQPEAKGQYSKVNHSKSTSGYPGSAVSVANEMERPLAPAPHKPELTSRKRPYPSASGPRQPWELSIKQLQAQQRRSAPASDTDSACSGDVSNADSGRGSSETGDHNSSAASHHSRPGGPLLTPELRSTQRIPVKRPISYVEGRSKSKAPLKHIPVTYSSSAQEKNKAAAPSQSPRSNTLCDRDNCLSNHPSPYWNSGRCHGHPPLSEDDGGSTTSGSYVVDTVDLDLDPSGQPWTAVTV